MEVNDKKTVGIQSCPVRYWISLLCFLVSSVVLAQTSTNPYNIDDECYHYMLKINKAMDKPFAQSMCDTLQNMAAKKHDLKAECISYSLRAIIYRMERNPKLIEVFPKYKSFLEKTPYLQYLYNVWSNLMQVYYALGQHDKYFQAFAAMRNDATKRNNSFGLSTAYSVVGDIYFNTGDFPSAISQYEKVYKILSDAHDKNLYFVENKLASSYGRMKQLEPAKKMIKHSIEHSPHQYKISALIIYMDIIIQNADSFSNAELEEVKKEIDSLVLDWTYVKTKDNYYVLNVFYYTRKRQLEKAVRYADSISGIKQRVNLKANIYEAFGKWDSAFVYTSRNYQMDREVWNELNQKNLASMAAIVDSSQLALENKQILVDQLKERQLVMELQAKKNTLELQNGELELSNRNHELLAQRQQTQLALSESQINKLNLEKQEQRNKELKEEQADEKRRSYMIFFILLFILLVSIVVIYISAKARKRLAREKSVALNALSEAEAARKQAERADSLKTLFLQNMSHEIRTPLNAIVGFSEVLNTPDIAEAMEPEDRMEMSRLIGVNSDLLLTLVNDILDMSKLESGTYTLQVSEVDVHSLCKDSLQSVAGREQKGVELVLDLPEETVRLHTDKQRIQQILINFLTNACKNTSAGRITLGYSTVVLSGRPFVRFYVEDTGCGIPKDKIDTIFKRFEKLDAFKQGTGLGLNICQLICRMVKGNIYVDPTYTGGARFVFEHPLSDVVV